MTGIATTPARASVAETRPAGCTNTTPSARASQDTQEILFWAVHKLSRAKTLVRVTEVNTRLAGWSDTTLSARTSQDKTPMRDTVTPKLI